MIHHHKSLSTGNLIYILGKCQIAKHVEQLRSQRTNVSGSRYFLGNSKINALELKLLGWVMHSIPHFIWQCIKYTAFSFLSRNVFLLFQLIHSIRLDEME